MLKILTFILKSSSKILQSRGENIIILDYFLQACIVCVYVYL